VKGYAKTPVGAHYGLGAWLLQRLTAVVMALYTIGFVACLLIGPPAT
jgi:succinate dehydrogenase / fumarate reductase, membrane anchor subunit